MSFLRIYCLDKLFCREEEISNSTLSDHQWPRGDIIEWNKSADLSCSEVRSVLTHFILAPCEAQEVLRSELPKFRLHCLHSFQLTCA